MKRMQLLATLLCLILIPAVASLASEPDNRNLPALVNVKAVFGTPHRPIPLEIRAPITVNGDIAYIVFSDVPAAAKLSHGINVDAGYWMVSARALPDLTITIPETGRFRIAVTLLDAHFRDVSAPAAFFVTTHNAAALLHGE